MSVVTKLPTASDPVVFSITEETIKRFEKYRDLKVVDIRDKAALKVVHDARMELVKARTTVDKLRKEFNEEAQKEIAENNAKAKSLTEKFAPIEKHLKDEEERVESALEAERVESANKVYRERCDALAEIGADPMPEQLIRAASDVSFEQLLVTARVQVEQKKIIAEQQRIAAEEAKRAEIERMRLQAEADERRAAEQAKLEAERAAFEKRQQEAAELQRKADEERARRIAAEEADRVQREAVRRAEEQAKLAMERAELESQRMAIEDERKRQEAAAEMLRKAEADRIEAEQRAAAEAERLKAVEAERIAAEQKEAEKKARLEAMRPDLEKLGQWIDAIEQLSPPEVSEACKMTANMLKNVFRDACEEMRAYL
jgi:hypothetical protein